MQPSPNLSLIPTLKRPMLTPELIANYSTDGAVCVRGAISPEWIDRLREGLAENLDAPSPRGRIWNRDEQGRVTFYDSQSWKSVAAYRAFVFESPMAELAGQLMESTRVNFFFDAVFVRAPGTTFRTPFHQDEPFWSVEGFQTCSAWMPLVPVERTSSLEVVRGSHRWPQRFRQTNFGALTGDERDQVVFDESDDDTVPFPDIERDHAEALTSWAMEPGDVLVFNGRCIHGGSGRLPPDRELQVFNTKWLGDDVRVRFRAEGMDPDHTDVMTAAGLGDGDRVDDAMGGELYPEVWRAG